MILSDKEISMLCHQPNFTIHIGKKQEPYWGTADGLSKHIAYLRGIHGEFVDIHTEDGLNFKPMIVPFVGEQVRFSGAGTPTHPTDCGRVISYGVSSYGYDVRIGREFKIFTNVAHGGIIDPKQFDDRVAVDHEGDFVIVPANGFVLARTMEFFNMPRDVTGIVLGKSTYARCGLVCIATPLEAGWSGEVVLEFANTTPTPIKLYAGEGAAQVLFFRGEECETSYADRNGKYQGQRGITLPRT